MRRLRAGGRRSLTHSGGLGSPSDPTTGVCHSCWLDVALVNGGKPSGSAECGALRLCPEERSRGQKSPLAVADCVNLSAVWRAVRRCAVAACRRSGGADRDKTTLCASRRAATPHRLRGDYPHNSGSLSRETARAWLFEFESVMARWRAEYPSHCAAALLEGGRSKKAPHKRKTPVGSGRFPFRSPLGGKWSFYVFT
jgi:hypothetical protein